MAHFCDVALPVPLDRVFTYAIPGPVASGDLSPGAPESHGNAPQVGCRVLVPFRQEKMAGIITRLHRDPPPVEAKALLAVLDAEPILSATLLELAEWMAQYYLCPLGEVLRSMLPLMAEVRRRVLYR
ncbi:MAG TPA: hypothetical protein VGD62_01945, partial [Acidobacteriaceae bacterium]